MSKTPFEDSTINPEIDLETWRRLYDLAGRVRALEPWRWMEEVDLIGVKDPDNGDCFFISVMGALGEHHAIGVYPGAEGLEAFWAMQRMPRDKHHMAMDTLLGIHQAQVQFGRKGDMLPHEKRIAAAAGHKAKGTLAWPLFRSMKPGWSQWSVDAREARLLEIAMEQLLDVAPRVRDDEEVLPFPPQPEGDVLMRVRTSDGDAPPSWLDTRCPRPRALPDNTPVPVPELPLEALRKLAPGIETVELEVFPTLMNIGPPDARPTSPFMFLAVEPSSMFTLKAGLLEMREHMRELRPAAVIEFLGLMQQHQLRPATVCVRVPWLAATLEGVCRDLGIELVLCDNLPALSEVRDDLQDYFSR